MTAMEERRLPRRGFLSGAASLGGLGLLAGCATPAKTGATTGARAGSSLPFWDVAAPLAPVRVHADRIFKITVCVRPFRAAGPRLDAETVGDKLVVHNYGHGGSGWSLSWGSGEIAVAQAMAGGARDIAVIGCGALGLTAALVAQRVGARVTIYAKERLPMARSSRATGTWSPDSRIALEGSMAPDFPARWEAMTRSSFRQFQGFLGLADNPVEWTDRYNLSDLPFQEAQDRRRREDTVGFAHLDSRVRDLTPRPLTLTGGDNPFPVAHARRNTSMQFNIAAYGRMLMTDFLLAGGTIETREFHSPAELAALRQTVVINCTGYGARALWKDETVVPVRGQIAWMIPQGEVRYGLYYRNVTLLGRRDGILIQQTGETEASGYGDASEAPDRSEAEAALKVFADLYGRMRGQDLKRS